MSRHSSSAIDLSIVIPAYNEALYISSCLASVIKEVGEIGCSTEVIVVNNGSTDATETIARSFLGVRVINEPLKGLARARQAGFEASRGKLIANVDADTTLPPGWLNTVLYEFNSNMKLVALSGPFLYEGLGLVSRVLVRAFYCLALGLHVICHRVLNIAAVLQGGNFVLRRTALAQIGGYNSNFLFYGEDTDIARRIQAQGDVKFTFRLWMYTSARRLKAEGLWKMGLRYALNYFWTVLFEKPYSISYLDIR